VPPPDDFLTIRAVSPLVNSVKNDAPELLEPVDFNVQAALALG
jgi:putative SOS response-associated peptidase YedK